MKLAVTGKGGTGKTTIAGIFCHLFKDNGFSVLAVDADPDANLASALGIPAQQTASLKSISQQRQLIKDRTGAEPKQFGQLFKMNPKVSDIPDEFGLDYAGIKLLVMGAVTKGGEGCACPENILLKSLLSDIILHRDEVVIVDMEAGVEHLGRATAQAIDKMLIIVEPGSRSIETAYSILSLGQEIGVSSFGVIGNKIKTQQQAAWINTKFKKSQVIGTIPYADSIQEADINQQSLIKSLDSQLLAEFKKIYTEVTHVL